MRFFTVCSVLILTKNDHNYSFTSQIFWDAAIFQHISTIAMGLLRKSNEIFATIGATAPKHISWSPLKHRPDHLCWNILSYSGLPTRLQSAWDVVAAWLINFSDLTIKQEVISLIIFLTKIITIGTLNMKIGWVFIQIWIIFKLCGSLWHVNFNTNFINHPWKCIFQALS